MADFLFSIPPETLPSATPGPELAAGAARKARPGKRAASKLVAQWRTEAGEDVGKPVPLEAPEPVHLEYPDGYGAMGWAEVAQPVVFASDPPAEAAVLRVSRGGAPVAELARADLQQAPRRLPQPQVTRIGPATAKFIVPIFSERYASRADFVAKVQGLSDWVRTQAPFDRPAVAARLAFDAFFWPSDPVNGLFHTDDGQIRDGRLFYGDRALARELLKDFVGKAPVSVILINSTKRGGAGGQPGYSAWTSTASAPGERWEAVCLHEIGHGLGLADEYLDPARAGELPSKLEPNISRNPKPGATPWKALVNLPDVPAPSFTPATEAHSPPGAIGAFQGARYRSDLYRPARTCLMLDTRQPFCPVCQSVIVSKLAPA